LQLPHAALVGDDTERRTTQMEPAEGMRVKVTRNGPYIVSGGVPMSVEAIVDDSDGESESWRVESKLSDRQKCGLCRCGKSGSKPLCDGSHMDVAFDGTETGSFEPGLDRAEVLLGPRIDVADQKSLCAEARFCHRGGAVWHLVGEDSDKAAETALAECRLCPSGRYTALDKATGEPLEPELPPSIAFVQDPHEGVSGPIWVRGGITVESADGREYEVRNRVTLCRCGQSKNKPFCDGSHVTCGFHDHL
jgi:CDGSH-type Zn-finger protein